MGNALQYIAYAGTSMIVQALSGRSRRSAQAAAPDFEPSTRAQQGTFLPLLFGCRRVGAVMAWVGERYTIPQLGTVRTKGSKKKKRPTGPPIYTEAAWHQLCVGPASKLHKIYEDGNVIWEGPITPEDTPSGNSVQLTNGDVFAIYWGESDQPVCTYLAEEGLAGRVGRYEGSTWVGVASRWPSLCYVVWATKTLGTAPRWKLIEYELETEGVVDDLCCVRPPFARGELVGTAVDTGECRVTKSGQTGTQTHYDESTFTIVDAGYYQVFQDDGGGFPCTISLNHVPRASSPAADWTHVKVSIDGKTILEAFDLGVVPSSGSGTHPTNECWVYDATSSAVRAWSMDETKLPGRQAVYLTAGSHTLRIDYTCVEDGSSSGNQHVAIAQLGFKRLDGAGGLNPVYVLEQVLFQPFPHGLGLDESLFDLDSFCTALDVTREEGLLCSVLAKDGVEAVKVIGEVLADAGLFLYQHPTTGLITLKAIRPVDTAQEVPKQLLAGPRPEVEALLGDRPASRLVFVFADAEREYRTTARVIDEDGQADYLSQHRAREINLPTVTDRGTANVVAERRSQEEFGDATTFSLVLTRGARYLVPGDVISVEGVADTLRVLEVTPDAESGDVKVTAVPDYYGAEPATYEAPAGGHTPDHGQAVAADEAATFFEVPAHLLDGGPPEIAVVRIRAHDQILFADVHVSGDDTTYRNVDREFDRQTGGELLDAIAADDPWEIEEGPTFTLLGPDADVVEDYSSDEASWRAGLQCALIGDELFFLQKITALGGDTYRLDGLIRARYDTSRAAHSIGATVFIFQQDAVISLTDVLLAPGADVWVKPQPWTASPLALGSVTAITKTLEGKGLVPPAPCALRVTAPRAGSASYRAGEDVTVAWASRISAPASAGIGLHGIGTLPVGVGALPPNTTYEVKVYDSTDTLVRTEALGAVTGWTYDNADLVTDLGGETNFSIEVTQIQAGYRSTPATLAVTAL